MGVPMHERDLGSLYRTWDDFDPMRARTYTPQLGRFTGANSERDWDPSAP